MIGQKIAKNVLNAGKPERTITIGLRIVKSAPIAE
jgi:hypothetical protein